MKGLTLTYVLLSLALLSVSSLQSLQSMEAELALGEKEDITNGIAFDPTEKKFCWKKSYARGAGKIPTDCAKGRTRIGLLCYTNCPAGYKRWGFDCHQTCPNGFTNQGLFCRMAEYGRGFGRTPCTGCTGCSGCSWGGCSGCSGCSSCSTSRCRSNEEGYLALCYPKCKPRGGQQYDNFGCCICRPKNFQCSDHGMGRQFDISCGKKIIIGDPVTGTCPGREEDAGLCYQRCRAGYDGVGPVCWGQPPTIAGKKWVGCGFGAAKDDTTCGLAITSQVMGPLETVIFVASLGTSGMVSGAAKGVGKAATVSSRVFGKSSRITKGLLSTTSKLSDKALDLAKACGTLCKKGQSIKDRFPGATGQLGKLNENIKKIQDGKKYKNAIKAKGGVKLALAAAKASASDATTTDKIRAAAEVASLIDPSGISSTVAAYAYPKCDKYY